MTVLPELIRENYSYYYNIVGDDNEEIKEMLSILLQHIEEDGLPLLESFKEKDIKKIRHFGHKFKTTFRMLQRQEAYEFMKALESFENWDNIENTISTVNKILDTEKKLITQCLILI